MADTEKADVDAGHGAHQNGPLLEQDHAPHHGMSPAQYLATRFSSLKPPMSSSPNPIALLRSINGRQWAFFSVAFIAWTWDAFDFFTVSLTVSDLAETFGKTNTDITWGITLVLMFRSIGSIAFGIAADRYGRKWPFIVNNILFIILELGVSPPSLKHCLGHG
jgi:SHS family lactate transporter-like MFS transporter